MKSQIIKAHSRDGRFHGFIFKFIRYLDRREWYDGYGKRPMARMADGEYVTTEDGDNFSGRRHRAAAALSAGKHEIAPGCFEYFPRFERCAFSGSFVFCISGIFSGLFGPPVPAPGQRPGVGIRVWKRRAVTDR